MRGKLGFSNDRHRGKPACHRQNSRRQGGVLERPSNQTLPVLEGAKEALPLACRGRGSRGCRASAERGPPTRDRNGFAVAPRVSWRKRRPHLVSGIVDCGEEDEARTPRFEPAMVTPVELDDHAGVCQRLPTAVPRRATGPGSVNPPKPGCGANEVREISCWSRSANLEYP